MLKMSWFRTHIRLTVAVVSTMLLLATTVTIFAGHLPFTHAAIPPTGGENTYDWAGYEADAARGTYTTASIQFNVPTITGSEGDVVSIWAGLGGDSGITMPVTLVQAGIGSMLDQYGNQINTPFWEVRPSVSHQTMPMGTINTGDTIDVTVASNWLGSGADVFSITDETTNDSYTTPPVPYTTVLSDSATAECTVEYPQVGGGTTHHFAEINRPSHTLNIDNCTVGTNADNSATGIGNVPHRYQIIRDRNSLTEMAAPGLISDDGNSFPVYWYSTDL